MPLGGVYGSTKSGLQARWGSDLDCKVKRPKVPRTALPSDVRSKLGLKTRSNSEGTFRSKNSDNNLLRKDAIKIKKKPFLRKGSGGGGAASPLKKASIALRSQTFGEM